MLGEGNPDATSSVRECESVCERERERERESSPTRATIQVGSGGAIK